MTEIDNTNQDQPVHSNLPSTTVAPSGDFEYLKAINDAWQNYLVAWYNSRETLDEPIYKYLDPENTKIIPMGVLKEFILDTFDIAEERVDKLLTDAVIVGDYRAVLDNINGNIRSLKKPGKWILYNELIGKGVIMPSVRVKEPQDKKRVRLELRYLSTLLNKRNKERPKGALKSGFLRKVELADRAHNYITEMLPSVLKLVEWLKEHSLDSYARNLLEKEYSKIIDANIMDLLFGKLELREGIDFSEAGTTAEEIGRIFNILSQWRNLGLTARAKERHEFRTSGDFRAANHDLTVAFSAITLMVSKWQANPVEFLAPSDPRDIKAREDKLEGFLEPMHTTLRGVRNAEWPEHFVINHDHMLKLMARRFYESNVSEPFLTKWVKVIKSLLINDNIDFAQDVASVKKLDDISASVPILGHEEEPAGAASKGIAARSEYSDHLKQEVIEFFKKPVKDRFRQGVEKKVGGDSYKWRGSQWINLRTGRVASSEIGGKLLAAELKRWGLPLVREYLTVLGKPDPTMASLVGNLGLDSNDMRFWIGIFNSENGGISESHIFAVFMALMEIKRYGRRKII